MAGALELHLGELGQVGQPGDVGESVAAGEAGREHLAEESGTGVLGDPGGRPGAVGGEGTSADQQRDGLPRPDEFGHRGDGVGVDRVGWRDGPSGSRPARGGEPADVGREHQGGHPTGRGHRGGDGVGGVGRDVVGAQGTAKPAGDGRRDGVDVALERGVVLLVVGGVVAHDVDHGRPRPTSVVQVGHAVAEPRAEVQQGGCRSAAHPGIAVGRAGDDTLEQAEDAAHLGHVVEGGHEVHLRGARVGEADVDTGIDEGADERLGAVGDVAHVRSPLRGSGCRSGRRPS